MLSMFLQGIITVILDVYLTKAYLVYRKIQEDSKLSGGHVYSRDTNQFKILKKKQVILLKTLMVVAVGNSLLGLMLSILFFSATFLESPVVYGVVRYILTPNIGYITFLLHPFAYVLYFKQVTDPMSLLKMITCSCQHVHICMKKLSYRDRSCAGFL